MIPIFFAGICVVAGSGQLLEPPIVDAAAVQRVERQLAELNKQIEARRSDAAAFPSTVQPNSQLMTLESIVTELELDALGKKSLLEQLEARAPATVESQAPEGQQDPSVETAIGQSVVSKQQIDQARLRYLHAQDNLTRTRQLLAEVKLEQQASDRKMGEYLRLLEARDRLRAQLSINAGLPQELDPRKATVAELLHAVSRTRSQLDQAQAAHEEAVRRLNEAMETTGHSAGTGADGATSTPSSSMPARESSK